MYEPEISKTRTGNDKKRNDTDSGKRHCSRPVVEGCHDMLVLKRNAGGCEHHHELALRMPMQPIPRGIVGSTGIAISAKPSSSVMIGSSA